MRKNIYYDREDNAVFEFETNKHHVIFKESAYKSDPVLQRWRGLGGFVFRMTLESHRQLHTAVEPPIKPCRDLMLAVIAHQGYISQLSVPKRFESSVNYLSKIALWDQSKAQWVDEASALVDNFERQKPFIDQGLVSPTRFAEPLFEY